MSALIKIGDTLAVDGAATLVHSLDGLRTSIKTKNFTGNTGTTAQPFTLASRWRLGHLGGVASGPDIAHATRVWFERINQELCLSANAAAMKGLPSIAADFGWSVAANGNVIGSIRRLTAEEIAAATPSNNDALKGALYLGAMAESGPYAIKPPFVFTCTARLPGFQRMWPGIWMLPVDGSWPPEIDLMEAYCWDPFSDAKVIDTCTLHSNAKGWTDGIVIPSGQGYISKDQAAGFNPASKGLTTGFHQFGCIVWPGPNGFVAMLRDGKVVFVFPFPSDFDRDWMAVLDSTVPSGAFTEPSPWPTLEISELSIYQIGKNPDGTYKQVWGTGGSTPVPTPDPTPAPIPEPDPGVAVIVSPGGASFSVGGHTYSVSATYDAMEDGKPIKGGDNTAAMATVNGRVYGQDRWGKAWYEWTGTAWGPSIGLALPVSTAPDPVPTPDPVPDPVPDPIPDPTPTPDPVPNTVTLSPEQRAEFRAMADRIREIVG